MIFQQDNDPKHISKLAQKWFNDQEIHVLDWPAQSPDLNPIEHFWINLKHKISGYDRPATGVWELWDSTETGWEKITPEECQSLVENLPRCLQAVIRAKGGNTKY